MSAVAARPLRVLLAYPRFAGNLLIDFEYMAPFFPGRLAVMPPLGLLTLAGALPKDWELRLVDENVTPLEDQDIEWADAVLLSGMHPQLVRIRAILRRAAALGKLTVLGGPSVSVIPESYPEADVLHVGEMGDATRQLIEILQTRPAKPPQQIVLRTVEKTPLSDLPLPELRLIDVDKYLVMPIQASVGCPFRCEFCDIPVIYGPGARAKAGARVLEELQAIYDAGFLGVISFVDDNLTGDRAALGQLLPDLIAWQRAHGYPYAFSAEASLNLAGDPASLQSMRDARFTHLFVGVESLDFATLNAISKKQNTRQPMLEALRTIQSYGIELLLGIILGFDSDTEASGAQVARFIDEAQVPIVYFNLLSALPETPLWRRLQAEGRLLDDAGRVGPSDLLSCTATNVRYRLPNSVVEGMLLDAIRSVYSPEAVYRRYAWNAAFVYPLQIRGRPRLATWAERWRVLRFTAGAFGRVMWRIGVRSDQRRHFWRFLSQLFALRCKGRIASVLETLLRAPPHAYHLIVWAQRLLQAVDRRDGRPAAGRATECKESAPSAVPDNR